MLLSGHNIVHYLLDKGFLTAEAFVKGEVKIKPLSSRNHCFLVSSADRRPLFIKQVRAIDNDRITTLRTEANVYWLALNDPAYEPIRRFIPKLQEYDYINHILVTEALDNAESLLDYYYRTRTFPLDFARQKARILACLHKEVSEASDKGDSRRLFRESMPAIFRIEESQLYQWNHQKPSMQLFLKLIRENSDYLPMIQAVRPEWASTCLIHSDIKNTNFLVWQPDHPQLQLIDWEVAAIGDPSWDLAAVLQSYFLFWIEYSIQQQPEYAVPGVQNTGFTIEEMQESIQAFWETYAGLMQWPAEEADSALLKTMKFCALKLIHTCTEASQQQEQMAPTSAAMLQLSFNILKDPMQALQSLLNAPQRV